MCLFHFWIPMRTFTVLFMKPEEMTTALSCREAEEAIFWALILGWMMERNCWEQRERVV